MHKSLKGTVAPLLLLGLAIFANMPTEVQSAEELPTVQEILQRYVDAVGGREALQKLTTRVCIGKETTDLNSRDHPIYESQHFEAYSRMPSSYYTETWTDAGNHVRACDGKKGWTKDKCGVQTDEKVGKRRLDWMLNPQNALVIEGYFPDLTLKGIQHVRGMTVFVVESPAIHRPLFFDKETGLLIGFGHNWEIHDYREVDGVLFPHRILMSRKGGSTVYEFSEVKHNIEIDNTLFAMPKDDK